MYYLKCSSNQSSTQRIPQQSIGDAATKISKKRVLIVDVDAGYSIQIFSNSPLTLECIADPSKPIKHVNRQVFDTHSGEMLKTTVKESTEVNDHHVI